MPPVDRRRGRTPVTASQYALMVAVAMLVIAWTGAILVLPAARIVAYSPRVQVGLESASMLARFFGALVLFLFPVDHDNYRLRWVAMGLLVLALGGLVFGYIQPLVRFPSDVDLAIYTSGLVRTAAALCFAVGLIPVVPPLLTRRTAAVGLLVLALSLVVVTALQAGLPHLARAPDLRAASIHPGAVMPGLTAWHWGLAAIPTMLSLVALAATGWRVRKRVVNAWLVIIMILFVGWQLQAMLWPSTYSPLVTSVDVLRFLFAAVVATWGIVELRRTAAERTVLLAAEREQTRRLAELGVLKADFTAMVAHELGSPLAAVRGFADLLANDDLPVDVRRQALTTIQTETAMLTKLVTDVQTAASAELSDFAVDLRPVPLRRMVLDATNFARTLPGGHPITVSTTIPEVVWADPERIGQVMRNVLGNAAKYSLPETPIEIQTSRRGRQVRIAIEDHGFGIPAGDLAHIFEKFGRGRDATGHKIGGIGLGLYLSRRIVQAHGSDLTVQSVHGRGSTFSFDLEVVL